MLLDQITSQLSAEQTPLWVTIVGWLITVFAAILPSVINYFHNKRLRKDIDELKEEKAQSVDRARFYDERTKLIGDLDKIAHALVKGVQGSNTLFNLESTLTTVQSYAERLSFSDADKLEIENVLKMVKYAQDSKITYSKDLRPANIQAIIEILKKGAYSQ